MRDQFSTSDLVSATARAIRDVSILRQRADKAGKTLATLTMESEVRFATPQRRRQFTEELLNLAGHLPAKYPDDQAEGGRRFRVLLGAYPVITRQQPDAESVIAME